eukprot:Nitzschia sp. Nitz4//scaffold44_size153857//3914//4762//NITZ4_002694-RA/size153857-processed-gene-0.113-mRNA-1//1//CDS//3329552076//1373//frame0
MNQFSLPANMNMNMNMNMDTCTTFAPMGCGTAADCTASVGHSTQQPSGPTLLEMAAKKGTLRRLSSFKDDATDSDDTVDILKQRVADFSAKGWLSQQEHRKYMNLIASAPRSSIHEPILQDLAEELDNMEAMLTGSNKAAPPRTTIHPSASNMSEGQQSTNSTLPSGTAIKEVSSMVKQLSPKEIKALFVETCFFARLGLVQPPCCLKCSYQKNGPGYACSRWVVWRRNAKHVLHPQSLKENVILVQCSAAAPLLEGKVVESYQWNASKKILQQTGRSQRSL